MLIDGAYPSVMSRAYQVTWTILTKQGLSLFVETCLASASWATASKSTGKCNIEEFPAQTGEDLFCYSHNKKEKDPDPDKELAFAMVEKLGDHGWEWGTNGSALS